MICIECARPVESLYTIYSNRHIQLTDCSYCQKVVDLYVEFDNVLLFIDLLLLKPGAYRHLVYNSLDYKLSLYVSSEPPENGPFLRLKLWFHSMKNWLRKFDKLNRVWLLLIAFEIYLTWIIEERRYMIDLESNVFYKHTVMDEVFSWDPLNQYFYFTFYCVFDIWIFHNLTQFLIIKWFHWGREIRNEKNILSYAILLSYGAKIFPILMLIWPYDTVFSMNIIKCVANLYIIESLKITTNLPYSWILQVLIVVAAVRLVLVNSIMFLLVAGSDWQFIKESFMDSATIYGFFTLKVFMTSA